MGTASGALLGEGEIVWECELPDWEVLMLSVAHRPSGRDDLTVAFVRASLSNPTNEEPAREVSLARRSGLNFRGARRAVIDLAAEEPDRFGVHARAAPMNYLFGRPVKPSRPSRTGPRELFVLGAYPSALHVAWDSPNPDWRIRAVAVDDEPEPFWNGGDEHERVARWSREAGFRERWGGIAPCGRLNGSSGVWVEERILRPLTSSRPAAWITDCIDTYFESAAAAARLEEPALVALLAEWGIPQRCHRPHPSEDAIVREAIDDHSARLLAEIHEASPDRVVTLGNAALRVFASLASTDSRSPSRLDPSPSSYGRPISARIAERTIEWLPLAHPAAPKVYQETHIRWMEQHAGK